MMLQDRLFPTLLVAASIIACDNAQGNRNQGIRLANSTLGSHAGRVEVMYHGRWGTICDSGWDLSDARVVCSMLNFTSGVVCAVSGAPTQFGQGTGTVWLSGLRCYSDHTHLDDCSGNVPQNINPCSHSRDAAVICQDPSVMPVPYNVTMFNHTTRSILVQWHVDFIPSDVVAIQFRLNCIDEDSYSRYYNIRKVVTSDSRDFNYTLTGLRRNTSYTLSIRSDGRYQSCSPYNYTLLIGEYSDPVIVFTKATVSPSTIPTRLVSNWFDTRSYIGIFQVQYQGVWGNICDDGFDMDDANLACYGLNYMRGAICYANSRSPQTLAPILLSNLNCRNADRIDDCTHSGWRVHNCRISEVIELVCNPGYLGVPVTGFRATNISPNRITVEWNAVKTSIDGYRLQISSGGAIPSSYLVRRRVTQYTFSYLVLGVNYTITIASALINLREFTGGNCQYKNFYGDVSDPIHVVTKESPPTIPIRGFHVSILNTTSVEVTWNPPSSSSIGINGVIRGYKLFVRRENETEERIININAAVGLSRVYILNDLVENVTYYFSILMYTVGDGPRSVRLRVTVPNQSNLPLIRIFGRWGDDVEVRQYSTFLKGFNVFCGSKIPDVTYEWRFANGSSIGISNQGFRAAHFTNGTAVLQIGTALLYTRRLTRCDGGVYTCVATNVAGRTEERNFTLIIGSYQPAPNQPTLVVRGSTWIRIAWDPLDCDGGYLLDGYVVQYSSCLYCTYTTAGEVTSTTYTIRNLRPNTRYRFRIGRRTHSVSTRYSLVSSFITLISGPSPPRSVAVMVGFSSEVCATWRRPSLPVGTIILYNLYAEPVASSEEIYDSVDLPNTTIVKIFPGSSRSGCMKLNKTEIIYNFQMSAVADVSDQRIEGTLSLSTTLFIPKPGIPQPINMAGNSTNTTVTVEWSLPVNTRLEDTDYFNVFYSGVVEWTSPTGAYSRFLEQGWIKTRDNSATFSYLTPSTNYVFSVAVVTDIETGPSASTTIRTANETGDKLAFFQVRLLKVEYCSKKDSDLDGILSEVKDSLMNTLLSVCLTQPKISQGEFGCRTGPSNTVVYRARISGTPSRSANDVRDCIRKWIRADRGSVVVDTRYHLDPTCDTYLESIHAPDCPWNFTLSTSPKPSNLKLDSESGEQSSANTGSSAGEVAAMILAAVIVGLLIALVILLSYILYQRHKQQELLKSQGRFRELVNEPGSLTTLTNEENM